MHSRVVITGIGMMTPAGAGLSALWDTVREQRSCVKPITLLDTSSSLLPFAGEVPDFHVEEFVSQPRVRKLLTRADGFCLAAAEQAMSDARIASAGYTPERGGVFLGTSKETATSDIFEDIMSEATQNDGSIDLKSFIRRCHATVFPLFALVALPNASLHFLAESYNLRGANTCFMTTTAAGSQAVGEAFQSIQRGECDYALAGGFDSYLNNPYYVWCHSLGILAQETNAGEQLYRPFDRDRTGLVLGEGSCILVLESLELAQQRGAHIYAEIIGYSESEEASGPLNYNNSEYPLAQAIQNTLERSGLRSSDIDYIQLYGEGTLHGDRNESQSIARAFGTGAQSIPVSTIKPLVGHLCAASGPLEVALLTSILRTGWLPPITNYKTPDPSCAALNYIVDQPGQTDIDTALHISRGLGGQNAVLALRRLS